MHVTADFDLTWHISGSNSVLPPPLLPALKDDPSHNDDYDIKHVKRDESHGVIDSHVVRPQQVEGPEDGKNVEDDVSEEWSLGESERLGDCDCTHHNGGNKYPCSCDRVTKRM